MPTSLLFRKRIETVPKINKGLEKQVNISILVASFSSISP